MGTCRSARQHALLTRPNREPSGPRPPPLPGRRLGAHRGLNVGARQNPDHNGQWQSGLDAARPGMLPTFQFTDDIIFNAENVPTGLAGPVSGIDTPVSIRYTERRV